MNQKGISSIVIALIVLAVLLIGAGGFFVYKNISTPRLKKETTEIKVEEEIEVSKKLAYENASKFELPFETEEKIRKGSNFPKSAQLVAYITEDVPEKIYQWHKEKLKQQNYQILSAEENIWKKDDELLMIGVIPAEEADELGIRKNLILYIEDKYDNWEDFLIEELGIVPEELSEELRTILKKWIDALFKKDWNIFFQYLVDVDGQSYSEKCKILAKEAYVRLDESVTYSLKINPKITMTCKRFEEMPPELKCAVVNYTLTIFGVPSEENEQLVKYGEEWKIQIPCKDFLPPSCEKRVCEKIPPRWVNEECQVERCDCAYCNIVSECWNAWTGKNCQEGEACKDLYQTNYREFSASYVYKIDPLRNKSFCPVNYGGYGDGKFYVAVPLTWKSDYTKTEEGSLGIYIYEDFTESILKEKKVSLEDYQKRVEALSRPSLELVKSSIVGNKYIAIKKGMLGGAKIQSWLEVMNCGDHTYAVTFNWAKAEGEMPEMYKETKDYIFNSMKCSNSI